MLFPEVGTVDLSDIAGYCHPPPLRTPRITLHEVRRAIRQAAPRKAPGPDSIPNLVLQQVLPQIEQVLLKIFNACLDHGYCPVHFHMLTMVILHKPGKDNYTNLKNYYLIALLSMISKIFKFIIIICLSYLVKYYKLLL